MSSSFIAADFLLRASTISSDEKTAQKRKRAAIHRRRSSAMKELREGAGFLAGGSFGGRPIREFFVRANEVIHAGVAIHGEASEPGA